MQKFILSFICGFLASIFFREATLGLLHAANLIDTGGFSVETILPLGLPEFIVNALWAACWAVLMGWLLYLSPERPTPWLQTCLFNGIALTAIRLFVMNPLLGHWPYGNIMPHLATGFIANAIWSWGALVLMRAFIAQHNAPPMHARSRA